MRVDRSKTPKTIVLGIFFTTDNGAGKCDLEMEFHVLLTPFIIPYPNKP
jgi:hypothetical protein